MNRDDINAAALATQLNEIRLYAIGNIVTGLIRPGLLSASAARKAKLAPHEAVFAVGQTWTRESVFGQFHRYIPLARTAYEAVERLDLRVGDHCHLLIGSLPPQKRWIYQGVDMGFLRFTDQHQMESQWLQPQDAESAIRHATTKGITPWAP